MANEEGEVYRSMARALRWRALPNGAMLYIEAFRVRDFCRLREVGIDLDPESTVFVGANNSGKASAAQVFRLFLGEGKGRFQIYDFTTDCWDAFDTGSGNPDELPQIELDIWLNLPRQEGEHKGSLDLGGEFVTVAEHPSGFRRDATKEHPSAAITTTRPVAGTVRYGVGTAMGGADHATSHNLRRRRTCAGIPAM